MLTACDAQAQPVPRLWVYKRGQLVLIIQATGGAFVPTRGATDVTAADGAMRPCAWGSGQYLSVEWEPRIRMIHQRARDLIEFIELLEDRHYTVDLEPPSLKGRPFRSL